MIRMIGTPAPLGMGLREALRSEAKEPDPAEIT